MPRGMSSFFAVRQDTAVCAANHAFSSIPVSGSPVENKNGTAPTVNRTVITIPAETSSVYAEPPNQGDSKDPGLRKLRSAAQFPPSDDRTPVGSKTPGVRRGKCRRAMCESEPTAAQTRTGIPFPGASHHLPLPSRDNKPPGAGGSVIFTHGVARFSPNHPAGLFSAASPAPVRSPQPEPHPVLQNPYRRKLRCRDVRRRFLR